MGNDISILERFDHQSSTHFLSCRFDYSNSPIRFLSISSRYSMILLLGIPFMASKNA